VTPSGDFKIFSWYPNDMQAQFRRLRAPWTYMTPAEKKQGPFQRPKRWFPAKEYKRRKVQKVFGLTTSNGKSLCFPVTKPYHSIEWAADMKLHVAPFLKETFPRLQSYKILLDGEPLFYTAVAKKAMTECNISVLPNWPKYSPDLNPQENVWGWAEKKLRVLELPNDTFEEFQPKILEAVGEYPGSAKLVGSMAKRCQSVLLRKDLVADC